MTKYSKLIAAVVGVGAVLAVDIFSLVPDGTTTESFTQSVLGLLTVLGVYGVKNAP